jgi:hypothetical protein
MQNCFGEDAMFYFVGRDLNRRTMDNSSITAKIADTSPVIVIANRIVLRRSTGKRYPPFSLVDIQATDL